MFLTQLKVSNFRNLCDTNIEFSKDLNVIYGDNAAGKSSLLEAVCYLVSGRSFRSSKQQLLLTHDSDSFTVFGRFSDSGQIGVSYQKKERLRKVKLNGKVINSLSKMAAVYPVQTLSPESYHLIDSGPLERRRYLDWLLFHVEHNYQVDWSEFHRLLKQRNAFFRNPLKFSDAELVSWDTAFLQSANKIDNYRFNLANELEPILRCLLEQVNFEYSEQLKVSYYKGYRGTLSDCLIESKERDKLAQTTYYGPHKADLKLKIGKYLAKDVLSRGQKKVLINCLILAQTQILKDKTNKNSLFIIDDFTSELDEGNQLTLIEALKDQKNVQIILSCLQAKLIKPLIKEYNSVSVFHVEHGQLQQDQDFLLG